MHTTVIIPARYASTRFPGKPLAEICGKPMIQWVYERSALCASVDKVIVATDDQRIVDAVQAFGGDVALTRPDHPTGTDRLAEVANALETDLVVNVQGDEPLVEPAMIDAAVSPLLEDDSIPMGTLQTRLTSLEEYLNPNVVKVVTDRQKFALYFSRAPIPYPRDDVERLAECWSVLPVGKHVGLYVYRRDFLLTYPGLAETPLELCEKLEQMRVLEHGYRIKVAETSAAVQGVDTPEDLLRVQAALSV